MTTARVQRYEALADGVVFAVTTDNTATHYSDEPVVYSVVQYDSFGRSQTSNEITATGLNMGGGDAVAPNGPKAVVADDTVITVSLPTENEDATAYEDFGGIEVRYSFDGGNTYTYAQAPDERASAVDQDVDFVHNAQEGQTITYGARVFDSSTNFSPWVNGTDHVMPVDTTPPATPTNLDVSPGIGSVFITWENPADADFEGVEVAFDETNPPTTVRYTGPGTAMSASTSSGGTQTPSTYHARIRAFDTNDNFSAWSDVVSVSVEEEYLVVPDGTGSSQNWLVIEDTNGDDKFYIGKNASGEWELHLATDMFIDAGGDLQMAGGDITLTSGNFNMNGGNMTLAGGTVTFNGAPVTIDGSNFTIVDGEIIVDGATAAIESSNFDEATRTGYRLDNEEFKFYDGTVSAEILEATNGPNLLSMPLSIFNEDKVFYEESAESPFGGVNPNNTLWDVNSEEFYYGYRSLKLENNGSVVDIGFEVDTTTPTLDGLDEGQRYIVSCYIKGQGSVELVVKTPNRDTATDHSSGPTSLTDDWQRIWSVVDMPAGETSMSITFLGLNTIGNYAHIDAVQAEPVGLTDTAPTIFSIGGTTEVRGSSITTGSIKASDAVFDTAAVQDADIANLDGGKITAHSISTRELFVGSLDNLIENPSLENIPTDPHVKDGAGSAWDFVPVGGRTGEALRYLYGDTSNQTGDATVHFNGAPGDLERTATVSEGEEFIFEIWANHDSGDAPSAVNMFVVWLDHSGTEISTVRKDISGLLTLGENERAEMHPVAPALAAHAVFGVEVPNQTTQNGRIIFDDAFVRKAVTSATFAADLVSDNYVAGESGWRIARDTGNVEFNDALFRGALDIGSDATGFLRTDNYDVGGIVSAFNANRLVWSGPEGTEYSSEDLSDHAGEIIAATDSTEQPVASLEILAGGVDNAEPNERAGAQFTTIRDFSGNYVSRYAYIHAPDNIQLTAQAPDGFVVVQADEFRLMSGAEAPTEPNHVASKQYVDEQNYRDFTTLINKTSGTVDAWVDWLPATFNTIVPDAFAGTVEVHAQLTGRMAFDSATASRRVGDTRIGISLDGGATWSYGQEVSIEVRGADARRVAVGNQHFVSGTKAATDEVQVKVQCRQSALGTAGDLVFGDGSLFARAWAA